MSLQLSVIGIMDVPNVAHDVVTAEDTVESRVLGLPGIGLTALELTCDQSAPGEVFKNWGVKDTKRVC